MFLLRATAGAGECEDVVEAGVAPREPKGEIDFYEVAPSLPRALPAVPQKQVHDREVTVVPSAKCEWVTAILGVLQSPRVRRLEGRLSSTADGSGCGRSQSQSSTLEADRGLQEL